MNEMLNSYTRIVDVAEFRKLAKGRNIMILWKWGDQYGQTTYVAQKRDEFFYQLEVLKTKKITITYLEDSRAIFIDKLER